MPTASPPMLPLPPIGVDLIDKDPDGTPNGKPSKAFTDWLIRLQAVVTKLRTEIP